MKNILFLSVLFAAFPAFGAETPSLNEGQIRWQGVKNWRAEFIDGEESPAPEAQVANKVAAFPAFGAETPSLTEGQIRWQGVKNWRAEFIDGAERPAPEAQEALSGEAREALSAAARAEKSETGFVEIFYEAESGKRDAIFFGLSSEKQWYLDVDSAAMGYRRCEDYNCFRSDLREFENGLSRQAQASVQWQVFEQFVRQAAVSIIPPVRYFKKPVSPFSGYERATKGRRGSEFIYKKKR